VRRLTQRDLHWLTPSWPQRAEAPDAHYQLAQAYERLLQRAYDAHDVHLVLLVIDPKWDAFRTEPQFKVLLRQCGFIKGLSSVGLAS